MLTRPSDVMSCGTIYYKNNLFSYTNNNMRYFLPGYIIKIFMHSYVVLVVVVGSITVRTSTVYGGDTQQMTLYTEGHVCTSLRSNHDIFALVHKCNRKVNILYTNMTRKSTKTSFTC